MNKQFLIFFVVTAGYFFNCPDCFAETATIDNINYELSVESQTAKVIPSDIYKSPDLVIPAVIEFGEVAYRVTEIGDKAFLNNQNIKNITISEGIESIGQQAFNNCKSVVAISLPSSIVSIYHTAFYSCTNVESVYSYSLDPVAVDSDTFSDITDSGKDVVLHVPNGCKEIYSNTQGWDDFFKYARIEDDIAVTPSVVLSLNAGSGGSILYNGLYVHNELRTIEIDGATSSVLVTAVPDHGYEFQSLSVTSRDGEVIHYSVEHQGGDVIATIPFEDGMVVSAAFAEPATYSLQIKAGEGSSFHASVNAGKAYSFVYEAPNGWSVSSVSFNDEPLDVAGVGGNRVSVTTPVLEEDSRLSFIIHDIRTGVEAPAAMQPVVRQINDCIVIDNLSTGAVVSLSDTTGCLRTYNSIAGSVVIDSIPEGIYVIKTGDYTFKIFR